MRRGCRADCRLRKEALASENGTQALASIEALKPRVVFLEIRMSAMSGIDVAQKMAGKAHVVFVTAYDEYAVAAFEEGAVDYVLKLTVSRTFAHRFKSM